MPDLSPDQVLVEVHRAGEAVVLDVLVDAVHALHLFRFIDDRGETDAAVADLLVEVRVGGAGHDVRRVRQAGERLLDGGDRPFPGFAFYVEGRGIVVRAVHDLHLEVVLLGDLPDDAEALLHALVRNEPHVGAHGGLLGQDVERRRAGLFREGDGRLQHGARLVGEQGQHLQKQRLEQPHVAEEKAQREARVGRQVFEHSLDFRRHILLIRVLCLHLVHERGEAGDRRVLRRRAGVAAAGTGGEQYIALALFKDAHHGEVTGDAADGFVDDGAALIADEPGLDPAALQFVDQRGAAGAGPLFRVGGGEVHVLGRHVALRQQFLDGLEERHDRTLGVGRAASPDICVVDVTGERVVGPLPFRRNDVLMAHEDDGFLGAFALPVVQKAPVDLRLFEVLMHQREQLFKDLVEPEELLSKEFARDGDGLVLDHLRQFLCVEHGPLRVRVRRVGGHLLRCRQRLPHRVQQRAHGRAGSAECHNRLFHSFVSLSFL